MSDFLSDPYRHVPMDHKVRLGSFVPMSDFALLKAISPTRGIIQALINTIFHAVVQECRKEGIRSYERNDDFIAIVRRLASACSTEQSGGVNGPRVGAKGQPDPVGAAAKPRAARSTAKGKQRQK